MKVTAYSTLKIDPKKVGVEPVLARESWGVSAMSRAYLLISFWEPGGWVWKGSLVPGLGRHLGPAPKAPEASRPHQHSGKCNGDG